MKKIMKKVCVGAWLLVFGMTLLLQSVNTMATEAPSEGAATKLYYFNENSWEKVYCWAWTMGDNVNLAQNAWPGDEMTDLGDGWFEYEVQTDTNIGILFNDGAGAQTADCADIEAAKTHWITNGSEELLNESGMGGGTNIVAAAEPKAGWPEGPEADESAEAPQAEADDAGADGAEADDAEVDDADDVDSSDSQADEAADKDSNVVPYVIISIAAIVVIAGVAVVVVKKKGQK